MSWNCSICTFSNSTLLPSCEICETPMGDGVPYTKSSLSSSAESSRGKRQKVESSTSSSSSLKNPYLYHLTTVSSLPLSQNPSTLTLTDVLSGNPNYIVLSNYLIQPEMLISKCPVLESTRTLVLAHTLMDRHWNKYDNTSPFSPLHPNIDVHYPKLNSRWGCMHSKFALVFYDEGVRVMITTANFIFFDWGNMTNGIYVQDFPLKAKDGKDGKNEFEETLCNYMRIACSQVSGSDVVRRLKLYDYTRANASLVASVPGKWPLPQQKASQKWGQIAMRDILSTTVPNEPNSKVCLQFSSLGSTKEKTIDNLVATFNTMMKPEPPERTTLSSQSTASPPTAKNFLRSPSSPKKPPLPSVIWPTLQCLKKSLNGLQSGGSIPAQLSSLFDEPTPNELRVKPHLAPMLYRWRDEGKERTRAAPHIKTFLRYSTTEEGGSGEPDKILYFVLTSHNFSQASWGAIQKKGAQYAIEHYEIGVVFTPSIYNSPLSAVADASPFSNTPNHPKLGLRGIVNTVPIRVEAGSEVRMESEEMIRRGEGRKIGGASVPDLDVVRAKRVARLEGGGGNSDNNIVDLTGEDDEKKEGRHATVLCVPVPYVLPPRKYEQGDVPWCSQFKSGSTGGKNVTNPHIGNGGW